MEIEVFTSAISAAATAVTNAATAVTHAATAITNAATAITHAAVTVETAVEAVKTAASAMKTAVVEVVSGTVADISETAAIISSTVADGAIELSAVTMETAVVAVKTAASAMKTAVVEVVSGTVADTPETAAIISSTVVDGAIELSAASTIGITCAVAASICFGFLTINHFKDKTTKKTLLATGWIKIDYLEVTKTGARIAGGILSAGLTEYFGTHYRVYKTEICDAAGNFLGSTVPQAIETARKLGEKYFKECDYHRAKEFFLAADMNCPSELKDIKRTIKESIDNSESRIQHQKGLDLCEARNFTEALIALQGAIDLCSDEDEKGELLKTYNNVKAEECYQRGQQIIRSSNTSDETEYLNAIDFFDEAIRNCSDDYSGRQNIERSRRSATANIEMRRNVRRAESYFMEGQSLWKDACDFEKVGDVAKATSLYDDSKKKFEEALRMDNNKAEYRKWSAVSNNKIEGNKLYNQMMDSMRQGNDCFNRGQYRDAKMKFTSADELRVNAQKRFTEIDKVLQDETSTEWLKCVEAIEKPLSNVKSIVSLHVPSEKIREICSPSVEMQSNGVPIFTMRN